jgi:hypothetical protein
MQHTNSLVKEIMNGLDTALIVMQDYWWLEPQDQGWMDPMAKLQEPCMGSI